MRLERIVDGLLRDGVAVGREALVRGPRDGALHRALRLAVGHQLHPAVAVARVQVPVAVEGTVQLLGSPALLGLGLGSGFGLGLCSG